MVVSRIKNFSILLHGAAEKGILLLFAALAALLIKNSKLSGLYDGFLHAEIGFSISGNIFDLPVHVIVNDLLMAIFFCLIGLEVKRELCEGHLSSPSERVLPLLAAVFGVVVPVIIYYGINYGDDVAIRGWAIPAATDIAFSLGILALFGKSIPTSYRIFLTALAIIDDIIAVAIIALFYNNNLLLDQLLYMTIVFCALIMLCRAKILILSPYMVLGGFLWYFCYRSGIHASIAGILLGLTVPMDVDPDSVSRTSPLRRLEVNLHAVTQYLIIPFFAFANSGINLHGMNLDALLNPITLGIALGLFVGKQVGITMVVLAAKKTGMKKNIQLKPFYGISALCGIGFTMSLLIAHLSFADAPAEYLIYAKLGIIIGSLLSAIVGGFVIMQYQKQLGKKASA